MDRKWMGMLLAAAFPLSSPALAEAQPATDQASAQPQPQPASPPSLSPSMTGPLHLNSSPLHVDGGPFGPIYVSGVTSRGYVVIQPNPRGSTGYGRAFQKANYQDLGGGDLKDELAAKQFLIDTGYVNAKRVGITGGSYGGFMTLMAIGRAPDPFAAAVEQYGIIDWRTMWQHEDALLQAYQKTLLGSLDQYPKVYESSSPITYIGQVRAPLLVLQGENDIRVPVGQARQVVQALKARGNVVDAIYFPEEGHGFYKREHQQEALQRTVEWFDRYLKGAPKVAETSR